MIVPYSSQYTVMREFRTGTIYRNSQRLCVLSGDGHDAKENAQSAGRNHELQSRVTNCFEERRRHEFSDG